MTWYQRSLREHDTHRGRLARGVVDALCGVRFRPKRRSRWRVALPGHPTDGQACQECWWS